MNKEDFSLSRIAEYDLSSGEVLAIILSLLP